MSERSEDGAGFSLGDLVTAAGERYEIPALSVVMAYMLWVRTRAYDKFVQNGEIFFRGNDPYYHLRETTYTVKHWPATMPYDPWTQYPYGTSADQFGTLFDQLIATAALVWGLGSPSQTIIMKTLLLAPAVFGTLVAIPVFFMGRRFGGRFGGVFGVVVLALLPGSFLSRSLVGTADHHVAEALFQAVAVLGIIVALGVVNREKPVYELLVDRDFGTLRRPLGWSALAGVAMALYIWTWPPGILLFAIAGAFFTVKLTATYVNGDSPEPLAFAGAVSMGVAGVLSLVPMNSLELSPTAFGLLQPGLAFAVAVGCVFLAWLAREFDDRDLDRRAYPVVVFGLLTVGVGVVIVALPDVFQVFLSNFRRFIGFSAGAETRTISEAQPFLKQKARINNQFRSDQINNFEWIFQEYGAMFFIALVAMGFVLLKPLLTSRDTREQSAGVGALAAVAATWQFDIGPALANSLGIVQEPVLWEVAIVAAAVVGTVLLGDQEPERLFVVIWGLFITAAAFTQARFNYYLAVVVAVATAYAVGQVMEVLGIVDEVGNIRTDVEPYQVMALMLALMVVLPGLVVPVTIAGAETRSPFQTTQSWKSGNQTAPGGVVQWDSTLDWMRNNTPREGNYGGAGNRMRYYGTYERPPDGDFAYANGTYGVMSWWDYGHWITVEGHRIPNANPFQQGATYAADFLLSPNESRANQILRSHGAPGEETRYVMVDWQMAYPLSKFSAPIQFTTNESLELNDFIHYMYTQGRRGQQFAGTFRTQRYFNSMVFRLYELHGSSASPEPLVLQWDRQVTGDNGQILKTGVSIKRFQSLRQARAYAANRTNAQVGGFGVVPNEYVPALEHYRLVKASSTSSVQYARRLFRTVRSLPNASGRISKAQISRGQIPSWVKVFERVPGATLKGTNAPPNSTVRVSVRMLMLSKNSTFTYTARAKAGPNGTFQLTVPYSTTGYEKFGPKNGHTNVSVRAIGPYTVSTGIQRKNNTTLVIHRAQVNVSESHVLGVNDSAIRFNLTEREIEVGRQDPTNNSTSNKTVVPALGPRTGTPAGDGEATTIRGGIPVGADRPVKLRESDPGWSWPGGTPGRAGLLVLLLAGLAVETRD